MATTKQLEEQFNDPDPKVYRHQVDAVSDPKLFEEEQVNAPIPKKGDPYAHQREDAPQQDEAKELAKEDAKAKKTVLKEGSGR